MFHRKMRCFVLYAVLGVIAAAPVHANQPLKEAVDLYASAAYDDALKILAGLAEDTSVDRETRREIDQYRAFCLYALSRTEEGDRVVEQLIRSYPQWQVSTKDASPRIEVRFKAIRKRLLPSIIRERFRSAKAAFDQRDVASAAQLSEVRQLVDEASRLQIPDSTLSDLELLIDGFTDLVRAWQEQERTSERPAKIGDDGAAPASAPQQSADALPAIAAPIIAESAGSAVADDGDPKLKGPVAIRRPLPTIPPGLLAAMPPGQTRVAVDLLIDENGAVENVTFRERPNQMLQRLLLDAFQSWRYSPATKSGVPVKARVPIVFDLTK
jgi:TonB family protein